LSVVWAKVVCQARTTIATISDLGDVRIMFLSLCNKPPTSCFSNELTNLNEEQFQHECIFLCVALCLCGSVVITRLVQPQRHRDTELHREESLLADLITAEPQRLAEIKTSSSTRVFQLAHLAPTNQ